MGSLAQISSDPIRCSLNMLPHQVPDKVLEGSGADTWWGSGGFRCRYLVRFRKVPVKGSGADTWWGSGGFRCRYLVRFRKVPVKGSGADTLRGSGNFPVQVRLGSKGFWRRCLVRFRKFPVQIPYEVPEGLGEDAVLIFRKVSVQILRGVPEGFGADTWWGSGSFRRRCLVKFWRVAVQIPCELPEVPVQHAKVPEGTSVWYWKKCWNYHAVGHDTRRVIRCYMTYQRHPTTLV